MTSDDPDPGRVQERAVERQRERAEHAENIYERVEGLLGEQKYPTTSEELAVTYGDTMLDLPNETESLGDVFDRLADERYESASEAREAVVDELTGAGTGEPTAVDDERPPSEPDTTDEEYTSGLD